jgi:hypothetical protein
MNYEAFYHISELDDGVDWSSRAFSAVLYYPTIEQDRMPKPEAVGSATEVAVERPSLYPFSFHTSSSIHPILTVLPPESPAIGDGRIH